MALAEAYVEAGIDAQDMTLAEALTWADEHGFLIERDRAAAERSGSGQGQGGVDAPPPPLLRYT